MGSEHAKQQYLWGQLQSRNNEVLAAQSGPYMDGAIVEKRHLSIDEKPHVATFSELSARKDETANKRYA
jgi:hypothetical protein